jgi:anti-anti-sigma factor
MAAQPFEATVRHDDDVAAIDMRGDINSFAEEQLNAAYKEAEASDPSVIMLSFTDVSYINSTGIALIVGLLAQARKSRKRLAVFGLSDHYLEIFQITRLTDFMDIYTDETSALEDTAAKSANS